MRKLITWDDKYSINNEELDRHHKTLFDIFNKLYDNCVENENGISFESLINELVSYTSYHFSAEEQSLRDIAYKDIDKHILEHKTFTDKILRLQSEHNIYDCEHSKELIVYLGYWILNHVIIEDKKISG